MEEKGNSHNYYIMFGKRIFDVAISAFALLMSSPIFVFTIVLIMLDSQGSPFFIQRRFGKNMKPFRLLKFRSMVADMSLAKKEFEPHCSSRVTRVGKILRKTKIDELPELINVLKGEMSIVGPRPEVEEYVTLYSEEFKIILKTRPGLSDYASIKYRNEEEILADQDDPESYYLNVILPDKLYLARFYYENINFNTDLSIILGTLKSILGIFRRSNDNPSNGYEIEN